MKKIYYLLAFMAVAAGFTSCDPLSQTYKDLGPPPVATAPVVVPAPIAVTITLASGDYALLPSSDPAKAAGSFASSAAANSSIPALLAAKYPTASDKSTANVTFAITSGAQVKPADSVFTHVAYTLVSPTDYLLETTFGDLSATDVIKWLGIKYPTPVANQLAVLTFIYYESGTTSTVTQSFMYLNNAWQKLYMVSPAQFTSIGKGGTSNDFAAADIPNIPAYLSAFLKGDPAVSATAKVGDVKYVSYKYYGGSAANTFQRVMALTYDGTNWVTSPLVGNISFTKSGGVWTSGAVVSATPYTLTTADYNAIAAIPNNGSSAATGNLASYHNFSLTGTTAWTDDQINTGISAVLKTDFPSATSGAAYAVTYSAYNGATITVTKTFTYNGTAWALGTGSAPTGGTGTAYTLTHADITNIIAKSNIGTAAERTNVGSYFDFDSTWAAADIKSAIILVLTADFPGKPANTVYNVTYSAYANSVDTPTVLNFTYNGTAWVAN